MTLDPRQDRTALRLQLYNNGFTPLPNHMKACFLPEWSTIKVTPEIIQSREWARSRAWSDTGLRCGDIIAIDWDVNDGDLLNALLDEVVAAGIITESPFVRVGRPPREMWIYRTADKIGKRTTGAFKRPDAPEDYEGEKVEILGAGNQFAAYGQRDENTAYSWPDQSLLDAKYMDLPEITHDQVEALKFFAIDFFERNGLERKSAMAGTDGGYNHVYDLTPDMVFDVKDMGPMTVAEIGDYLRTAADEVLRCGAGPFRPSSGRNDSCMVSLVQGAVCISDHGEYAAHFLAELDDNAALSRLGALLSTRIESAAVEAAAAPPSTATADEYDYAPIDPKETFDENLRRALRRYVFVQSVVYDLGQDFAVREMRDLANDLFNIYETRTAKRGPDTVVRLFDMWKQDAHRLAATSAQMRPDMPRPFFTEDNQLVLNTYRPVRHDGVYGDAGTGLDMLARLLPVPEELRFFKQWLSHKIQYPAESGQAIVMVASDEFGTGRGSLFSLLRRVFGARYVESVDFKTISGQTSQSQYNEWRADNLLITVNEAQDTSGGSRWQNRNTAYEALKDIVDPGEKHFRVARKSVKNGKGVSYISLIVATNHSDALVIPSKDRRFAVLENGLPQPQEYWDQFHKWMRQEENVSAFVRSILAVDLAGYSPHTAPPMTRAKLDMIEAGASDIDRVMEEVLNAMPGRLAVKDQVMLHIEDYLAVHSVEMHDEWRKTADAMFKRRTRKPLGVERVVLEGRQCMVRELRGATAAMSATADSLRAELEKNGPVSRTLKTGGTVVSFPQRR